jgi:hypothetical protein
VHPGVSITGSTITADTVRGSLELDHVAELRRQPSVQEPVQAGRTRDRGVCTRMPPVRKGSYGVRSCGHPVDVSAPIVAPW